MHYLQKNLTRPILLINLKPRRQNDIHNGWLGLKISARADLRRIKPVPARYKENTLASVQFFRKK